MLKIDILKIIFICILSVIIFYNLYNYNYLCIHCENEFDNEDLIKEYENLIKIRNSKYLDFSYAMIGILLIIKLIELVFKQN